MKINYYQVSQFPVKIYDLPGFENEATVNNAVRQFQYLNEEIRQLQDQIHIFLYFIKSTDERMFTEMEYSIMEQIVKHKDSYVIYVLTHSSEKTDKKEIYDMINTGLRGVIDCYTKKLEEIYPKNSEHFQNIYLKMVATKDNCVFVNFHSTEKSPLYGISDFFNKIVAFTERTEAYRKFQKDSCINEEEFEARIKEEEKIKYFIKKDAVKKAGQIFGFDIEELENSLKYEKDKNENRNIIENNSQLELKNENGKIPRPKLSLIKEEDEDEEDSKELINNINKEQKKETDKKVKYRGYGSMYTCAAVSWGTYIPRLLIPTAGVALLAVSATFTLIGSAIGAGVGYYLMKRHCEDLLDQFELLFIQNADRVSNSLIFGINYLKNMAK